MNELTKEPAAGDIEISLPKRILAEVIVNFLGKREQLTYKTKTFFKVELRDLTQFHYLLEQKVRKETYTDLIFFEATIVYDDQTSRKLTTIESLEQFHEPRNVIAVSATLRWHFVFKFPESDTVETQKVSMSFRVGGKEDAGLIDLAIEHTNQAWANEVLALLKGQVLKVAPARTKKEAFYSARKYRELYTLVFMPTLLVSLILMTFLTPSIWDSSRDAVVHGVAKFEIYESLSDPALTDGDRLFLLPFASDDLSREIPIWLREHRYSEDVTSTLQRYLQTHEGAGIEREGTMSERTQLFIALLTATILVPTVLVGYWKVNANIYSDRSFLLLTSEAGEQKRVHEREKEAQRNFSIAAIVFAILTGVAGNVVVHFLLS